MKRAVALASCSRQRDKLREELTLAQTDRRTEAVDGLDVQDVVTLNFTSWNQISSWLRRMDALRAAA